MRNFEDRLRTAPRLLMTLVILALLAVGAPAPLVSAADTAYTATQIETWLEDTLTGTVVTVTASPVVTLTPADDLMRVTNLSFQVRGVTVGLNELRVTTPTGTTTVHVVGELNVLGKAPRFSCDLQMEHTTAVGKLQVAEVSNIVIAGTYSPSLSAGDLTTIKDTLNELLDASGLSTTSPGGDLTGIDVVDDAGIAKLMTTWSVAGSAYLTAAELQAKLDGMANTLAGKATDYLAAGEGNWTVTANVVSDAALEIDAMLTVFGITATLDSSMTFSTLTATITDAAISVNSKTFTFSAQADIGCSANVPSVAMVDLTVGDEYAGFQQFIADTEAALLDAIDQAVASIVDDTGLTWPDATIASITVEGTTVVLHGGLGLVEGDANLDGVTNIIDAMVIAQYTVQLREFTPDQVTAGDTTDDGFTNITDAMHIAQFTVDPTGIGGVLFKPLWQESADAGMINPLDL